MITIEEVIKKTYEAQGFAVEEVVHLPNGSFDVTFIGDCGIVKRNLALLFLVNNANQCQGQKVIPND